MPTNNIDDACKAIQDVWPNIRSDFFALVPNHYLILTTVYRSPEEQFELFNRGRTMDTSGEWIIQDKDKVVTNVDGHKNIGAHNYKPSRAIDVCAFSNETGKPCWEPVWYGALIQIADKYGLVSGGSWRSIKDYPHLEVKDFKNYSGA